MKEQSEYKGGGYDGESLVQKRKKRSHPLALLAVRWTKWSGLLFPFAAGLPYFDSGSRGKCLSLDNHIFPLPEHGSDGSGQFRPVGTSNGEAVSSKIQGFLTQGSLPLLRISVLEFERPETLQTVSQCGQAG